VSPGASGIELDAKTHLSRLLEQVAAGERVVISKAGTRQHLPSVHLLSKYSGQESLWAADATRGGLEPLLSLEEDAALDVDGTTKSAGLLARTVAVAVGAASVHRDSQVPKSRVMPCPTRPRPPSQKTNEPVARVDSLPASST
jgi:hypothetical protein